MRHNRDRRSLNRTASHRKAMLSNMVTSLFESERIRTSAAKAKEARRIAERMITFAKRGDLSARRHVARMVKDPGVLRKLFEEIGPRFADREGGYTRILRLGKRGGDSTDMAMLELLSAGEKKRGKKAKPRKKYHKVDIPEDPVEVERKKAGKKAEAEKKEKEKKEKEETAAKVEEAGGEAEPEKEGKEEKQPAKKKAAKQKKEEPVEEEKAEEENPVKEEKAAEEEKKAGETAEEEKKKEE